MGAASMSDGTHSGSTPSTCTERGVTTAANGRAASTLESPCTGTAPVA